MEPQSSKFQNVRSRIDFDQELLGSIISNPRDNDVKHTLEKSNIWSSQDKQGNTLLHIAAKCNNQAIVQYLIDSGCQVNMKNDLGKSPLIVAIENGSKGAIKCLLEGGADMYGEADCRSKSALHAFFHTTYLVSDILKIALEQVQTDCLYNQKLIADRLHQVGCPLYHVILLKDVKVTEIMLERGCKVDAGNTENQTALHIAVRSVDVEHVKLLLEYNADPNAMDVEHRSPLYYLYYGSKHSDEHLQILKMLLDRNAALTLTDGHSRWRQVTYVLKHGNRDAIEILLHANLDLYEEDGVNLDTPVHALALNNTPGVLQTLNNWNFEVNARNWFSETPLYCAAHTGNAHAVEYLLKRGADVNPEIGSDCRPLFSTLFYYCDEDREDQYKECIRLLLEYGADPQLRPTRWNMGNFLTILQQSQPRSLDSMGEIVIAHLVVKEALGRPMDDCTRHTINLDQKLKTRYDFCRQQLSTVVDKSVTLLDLLRASESEFTRYARNHEWTSKIQDFCSEEKPTFCYLDTMLQRRIKKTVEMIKLRVDAACVICDTMTVDYASFYIVGDKIVGYLSELDLQRLLEVLS